MLWHRCWGEPKNPPLFFIHGFMGSHHDFATIIDELKEDFYCLAVDLPGHANSSMLSVQTYSCVIELLKQTIAHYLSAPPAVIGYSLGARLAAKLGETTMLHSLTLISGKVRLLNPQELQKRKVLEESWAKSLNDDDFNFFLDKWYCQNLFKNLKKNENQFNKMLQLRKKEDPKKLSKILRILSPINMQTFIEKLSCPLLYLAGEEDEKYMAELNYLKKDYPQTWVGIGGKLSHALLYENPSFVKQMIQIFVRNTYDRLETNASI